MVISEGGLWMQMPIRRVASSLRPDNSRVELQLHPKCWSKTVIDAYTGTVTCVAVLGPAAATYPEIFAGLFKPLAAMPQDFANAMLPGRDLFSSGHVLVPTNT